MRFSSARHLLSVFGACVLFPLCAHAYFNINEPSSTTQWVNDKPNLVTWTKGVLDGINGFDIELARLSNDGLIYVARDVPVTPPQVNIYITGVPSGDDYFVVFINSTSGAMAALSQRFTILDSGATPSGVVPNPAANVPTVTVSGGPNPTAVFVTTFPASTNAAGGPIYADLSARSVRTQAAALAAALVLCVAGGAWVVL